MRNFYIFIACFFIAGTTLSAQNVKMTGTIIGTEGSWGDNPETTIDAAFDGDVSTYCDPVGNGAWAGLDLGNDSLSILTVVRYAPRSTHPGRMVGNVIQGSHDIDFTHAVSLDTIIEEPPADGYSELVIDNPDTAYRYIRLMSPNSALNVAEIEFYRTDTVYVTAINVTGTGDVTSILNGETLQMLAEVLPTDAYDNTITWSVNNESVATIHAETGLLTAVGPGEVVVTATAVDGSKVSGSITLTITEEVVLSDNAYLSSLTTDVGELSPAFDSATFTYALSVPGDTATVNITAEASSSAATVTGDGAIDMSSGGTTVNIKVDAEDGAHSQTYVVNISVETSGIHESEISHLHLYPNPVVSTLNVDVAAGDWIRIYNTTGQLVKQQLATFGEMTIDVAGFEPGPYILTLTNGKKQIRSRFIKVID